MLDEDEDADDADADVDELWPPPSALDDWPEAFDSLRESVR